MIFDELVVHNFVVYRGRHHMVLSPPTPDRPIVLIGGLNGAGKTTLLDALQLVLYGSRARCSNRGALSYEEYLRRCVHRRVPPSEGAALELSLRSHVDGHETAYRIHRSWSATPSGMREHLEVLRDGERDPVLADGWAEHVEEILPLDIASLFFFDGEKIEALVDPDRASAVIATAVEALLGLNHIDRLRTDLSGLVRRKRAAQLDANIKAEVERLEADVARAAQLRADPVRRRAQAQTRLDQRQERLRLAEQELRRQGGEAFEHRAELEAEQRLLQQRRSQLEEELRETASGALPLLFVRPLLDAVAKQAIREHASANAQVLASTLAHRDQEVVELLAKHHVSRAAVTAIADFLTHDRQHHQELAGSDSYLELGPDAVEALGHLRAAGLQQARQEASRLAQSLAVCETDLEVVDRKLAGVPAPELIAEVVRQRDEAATAVAEARGQLAAAEDHLRRATLTYEEAMTALHSARVASANAQLEQERVSRVLTHAAKARDTLDQFRRALLTRHVSKIEVAVLNSFRRLLRKEALVADLRLDRTTFTLQLFDRNEQQLTVERLSAGERQLLAVALLWGLGRVSGKSLPTVIDTPLGRLDSDHRRHLVERYFPYASDQVILLSTDREIDEDLGALFATAVGRRYRLDHDDTQATTRICSGYFWEQAETDVA